MKKTIKHPRAKNSQKAQAYREQRKLLLYGQMKRNTDYKPVS